jgi:hypothetical protein
MEPKGSLPCSQYAATGPNTEPDESLKSVHTSLSIHLIFVTHKSHLADRPKFPRPHPDLHFIQYFQLLFSRPLAATILHQFSTRS